MGTVYRITNTKTERVYIGSTLVEYEQRVRQHKYLLEDGKHHNKQLQSDYDKMGGQVFTFDPIIKIHWRYNTGLRELEEKEIEKHSSLIGGVYNITTKIPTIYSFSSKYIDQYGISILLRFKSERAFRESENYKTVMLSIDKIAEIIEDKILKRKK